MINAQERTKEAASKDVSRTEEKGLTQREQAAWVAQEQALVLTVNGLTLGPKLAGTAAATTRTLSPPVAQLAAERSDDDAESVAALTAQ